MLRVTQILELEGITNFSSVPDYILEPAQNFGSCFHKAAELSDLGKLDISSVSPALLPLLESWEKIKKDYLIKIIPEYVEKRLESKKYGFCGTPDRICRVGKSLAVIDLKTTSQEYPSTQIQTAAYQILAEEAGFKIKKRYCVRFDLDGKPHIKEHNDTKDRVIFLSALNLVNWKLEHGILKLK